MTQQGAGIPDREKSAQFLWTAFILAFFLIQAVIWIVAITLTTGDKSHAVVAGYDAKALRWDEEVALRNQSDELGWSFDLAIDPQGDIRNQHAVTLTLQNDEEEPVKSAVVDVTTFHRGQAGDPQAIPFKEIAPGVYEGTIQITKAGQWQFEGAARLGTATFFIDDRRFLETNN